MNNLEMPHRPFFCLFCFFNNLSVWVDGGYFRYLESILVVRHGRTEMGLCPFQGNMSKASTVCVSDVEK